MPAALHAHNGGYSNKRAANAGVVDTRAFDSSYLLSRPYVNQFQNEVKSKKPEDVVNDEDEDAEVSNILSLVEYN